jgi:polyketide cyclase/dehydrase/lipid transport protein
MEFTEEMNIDCPSTTVFDLMADVRNELRWNEGISRAELTTDEPVGEGSQFVVVDRRGEHEATITVFDRPERLEFALRGKSMDVAIKYTYTETDGRTTSVGTFNAQPKGFMKVLLPLLMPLIKRDVAKQHVNFRTLCESQVN